MTRNPSFLDPQYILERPIDLEQNDVDILPMNRILFPELDHTYYQSLPHQLVYSPNSVVSNEENSVKFDGKFECGNLGNVYQIGEKMYEIHILPDPNHQGTSQWFFFHASNLMPGKYAFIIAGF